MSTTSKRPDGKRTPESKAQSRALRLARQAKRTGQAAR